MSAAEKWQSHKSSILPASWGRYLARVASYDPARAATQRSQESQKIVLLGEDPAVRHGIRPIPQQGRRFGPYEILSRLGGGGMGVVYRAWDERLHREVALKILHDTYQPPGVRQRFLVEARAASALNHPHICTIFDIGEQDGDPYLVMELIEGMTLKERITLGAPPIEELVRYAIETADALAAAHAKKIIHRDIKPENIFLQRLPDGRHQVKVLDFGLAKIRDEGSGTRMARAMDITSVGLTVGTLAYMSPEQARGEPLDVRSDLFSLGVVMYEMGTRRVPFQGANSAVMLVELLRHDPEPMRNWNEGVPRAVEKLVARLLSKDRAMRFQTAVEVREALRKLDLKGSSGWRRRPKPLVVPLVHAPDPGARVPLPLRRGVPPEERTEPAFEPNRSSETVRDAAGTVDPDDPSAARPMMDGPGARHGEPQDPSATSHTRHAGEHWIPPYRDAAVRESGSRAVSTRSSAQRAAAAASTPGSEAALSGVQTNEDPQVDRADAAQSSGAPDATAEAAPSAIPVLPSEEADVEPGSRKRHVRVLIGVLTAAVVAIAGVLLERSGVRFDSATVARGEQILLTPAQNRTGDATLDGVVGEGTAIELGQATVPNFLGLDAYTAGRELVRNEDHEPAETVSDRRVAQALHVRWYVYGELRRLETGYVFSLQLLDSDSNDPRASAETSAATRESLPGAIEQAARQLRLSMGETAEGIAGSSRPIAIEGSRSASALSAYQTAREAELADRSDDTLAGYGAAVARDPRFAQAAMGLAWMEAELGDETSAREHAHAAVVGASSASEPLRLLAASTDALLRQDDPEQALEDLRRYEAATAEHATGPAAVARLRRQQWRFSEALLAAQQAVNRDPYDPLANRELALAYVGLDRPRDAAHLFEQARHFGVTADRAVATLAGYLAADRPSGRSEYTSDDHETTTLEAQTRALLLDNEGQLARGAAAWRHLAQVAARPAASAALAASMLATAALDRALPGQCQAAREFWSAVEHDDAGPMASFRIGLAEALCGETAGAAGWLSRLKLTQPRRGSRSEENLATLEAAIALSSHNAQQATELLRRVQRRDESPVAVYIRGLASMGAHQWAAASDDLESVAARRGAALLSGTDVYPAALGKLAEAYAAQGDPARSAAAKQRLREVWAEIPPRTAVSAR